MDFEGRQKTVRTAILEAGRFWPAEDYHQKWRLRRSSSWAETLIRQLGGEEGLRDSTAAARLNGWFGGHGKKPTVDEIEADFGWSRADAERLVREISRY